MTDVVIYHNPRCSKSRKTLSLLEEKGATIKVVRYLEDPPDAAAIRGLLSKLGLSAAQLVRRGEEEYKTCGLSAQSSEQDIVSAMAAHPRLIERPIVVRHQRAVLGRPPENVLELLDA